MRLITDILRDIRKGRAINEATRALNDVVRAVDETGKTGTLTLTIKVKPEKGGGNQKTISCLTTPSIPRHDAPEGVFFSDRDGDLHRSDPNQEEMFSEVETGDQRLETA